MFLPGVNLGKQLPDDYNDFDDDDDDDMLLFLLKFSGFYFSGPPRFEIFPLQSSVCSPPFSPFSLSFAYSNSNSNSITTDETHDHIVHHSTAVEKINDERAVNMVL
jgi:hypothetical protein